MLCLPYAGFFLNWLNLVQNSACKGPNSGVGGLNWNPNQILRVWCMPNWGLFGIPVHHVVWSESVWNSLGLCSSISSSSRRCSSSSSGSSSYSLFGSLGQIETYNKCLGVSAVKTNHYVLGQQNHRLPVHTVFTIIPKWPYNLVVIVLMHQW